MFLFTMNYTPIVVFNLAVGIFFALTFAYQIVFTIAAYRRGTVRLPEAARQHRYAFVIAAHNEEAVIAELVQSILEQDYPHELIDIFVVADACTDSTAECARRAGAIVYERNDLARKGKSWVLDYAFDRILNERPDTYEGFFVFDADNILSPSYTTEMNKAFDMGYLVVTGYRNSKNFDSSWISSSYAISFLRESKYLNNSRMLFGTGCMISGSGWLVSADIVDAMHGWDFHTLTEDIQFSAFCSANGIRIGYAPAEFFDEQPVTFAAAWKQRLRWSKGFYQVLFSYARELVGGIGHGYFMSYDVLATVGFAGMLTVVSVFANGIYLALGALSRGYLATDSEMALCASSLIYTVFYTYVPLFILAVLTCYTEREHIHVANPMSLVKAVFVFPIFMLTYIPINVVALFKKVEWVPTKHTMAMSFDQMVSEGDGGTAASDA